MTNTKQKTAIIRNYVIVCGWALVIFILSNQPAAVSSGQSGVIVGHLQQAMPGGKHGSLDVSCTQERSYYCLFYPWYTDVSRAARQYSPLASAHRGEPCPAELQSLCGDR